MKLRTLAFLLLALLQSDFVIAAEQTNAYFGSWISFMPPMLAIFLALWLRQVIPALFLALWLGAWAIHEFSATGLWNGLLDVFSVYVRQSLADEDNAAIILFTMMISGMVGIITRNGGMQGMVNRVKKWANSPNHAQTGTALMGLVVFFDDFANTMIVGNTMRPVADSMRVSREKLAYIVDSTAAPVASLAFVTAWIGYEVGLIDDAIKDIEGLTIQAYELFLTALPYNFYPILAIFMVFAVALSGRDFGPMLQAEKAAAKATDPGRDDAPHPEIKQLSDELAPKEGAQINMVNALLPIFMLIAGVVSGIAITGEGSSLREIIGSADSFLALMWGSFLGALTAAFLSVIQGVLTLEETVEAWLKGVAKLVVAIVILLLAWGLASITKELGTAQFLVSILGGWLPVELLPLLVFVIAALVAFSTGTSWGTMGILMPLVPPLAWALVTASGGDGMHILASSIACVLAGAVWGDHCSPISDTTILSSTACGCDHIEHVRTQIPYAMTVGAIGLVFGTLPTALGLHWAISYPICMAIILLILYRLGENPHKT